MGKAATAIAYTARRKEIARARSHTKHSGRNIGKTLSSTFTALEYVGAGLLFAWPGLVFIVIWAILD